MKTKESYQCEFDDSVHLTLAEAENHIRGLYNNLILTISLVLASRNESFISNYIDNNIDVFKELLSIENELIQIIEFRSKQGLED